MEDQQLDENFVKGRLKVNVWRLEKLRIWFNLILGSTLLLPLFVAILNRTPYNPFGSIVRKFIENDLLRFLFLMIVYNIVFSILYLFEKSEISRNKRLMTKERLQIIFGVVFAICFGSVLLLFRGGL